MSVLCHACSRLGMKAAKHYRFGTCPRCGNHGLVMDLEPLPKKLEDLPPGNLMQALGND